MITRYQVKAGEGSSQVKTGKYFNLLTSFNPVRLVIRMGGKELLTTEAAAGMSFTFENGFDEIEFYSDVTQSLTYWASNTKLEYAKPDTKENGASFIESSIAYARGGQGNILIPAKRGRRSLYITPLDSDLKVGGFGLTGTNGYEVKKDQEFKMDLEGDLFGWFTDRTFINVLDSVPFDVAAEPVEFEPPWPASTPISDLSLAGCPFLDFSIPPQVNKVVIEFTFYLENVGSGKPSFALSIAEPESDCLYKNPISASGDNGSVSNLVSVEFDIEQKEENQTKRLYWFAAQGFASFKFREIKISNIAETRAVRVLELLN